jgi:plasmid rolling circle replication initiator protein Rep
MYGRYVAVNLSWIIGSFGTLLLDAGVFVQYFMYQKEDEEDDNSTEEAVVDDASEAEVSATDSIGK